MNKTSSFRTFSADFQKYVKEQNLKPVVFKGPLTEVWIVTPHKIKSTDPIGIKD